MANESGIQLFIDAVENCLAPDGSLLMPAFTYSLTKGQVYDVRRTASEVGMISEVFRRRPETVRTRDPIFSFAIAGAQKEWHRATEAVECFGADSVFDKLHRQNAWILWMGCAFNSTFVHFVEKRVGVGYRYDKRFQGVRIPEDGREERCECVYYVRDLSRKTSANSGSSRLASMAWDYCGPAISDGFGVGLCGARIFFAVPPRCLRNERIH